jgi:hypothetical protein
MVARSKNKKPRKRRNNMDAGNVEVHSAVGIGFTKQTEKKGLTMAKNGGKLVPNSGQGNGMPCGKGGKGGTCIGTPKTNGGKGSGKKSGC